MQLWTWQSNSRKAPWSPKCRQTGLAAPKITKGTVKSIDSTNIFIEIPFDATMGHQGDLEGAHGQLRRLDLRGAQKSWNQMIADLEVKTTAQACARQQDFCNTLPGVNRQRDCDRSGPQGARGPTEACPSPAVAPFFARTSQSTSAGLDLKNI